MTLFFASKGRPFNVHSATNISNLLASLKYCGFQARNLGKALDILYKMVNDDDCLTILTLSGAMVPAGMGDLICVLMEYKLIDVLVSTGANITHDFIDAVSNGGHYLGNSKVDDKDLYQNRINRIYNIFLPESNYDKAENILLDILLKVFPQRQFEIIPSEFFNIIGEQITNRCILSGAVQNDIPIFVQAISDSEFTLNLNELLRLKLLVVL